MIIINVNLKINDYEFETKGTINENIIYFNYDDAFYSFDKENIILEKKDNDTLIKFDFKNKLIIINDLSSNEFYLNILIKNLKTLENTIIINYQIEEENFYFKISFGRII